MKTMFALGVLVLLLCRNAAAEEVLFAFDTGDQRIEFARGGFAKASLIILTRQNTRIAFCLKDDQIPRFEAFTRNNLGRPFSLYVEGKRRGSAVVKSIVSDGCGVAGGFSRYEAEELREKMLKAGPRQREIRLANTKPNDLCPEESFVEICVKALTSLDAVRRWGKTNRWEMQEGRNKGGEAWLWLTQKGKLKFRIAETRFSDLVDLYCWYDWSEISSPGEHPVCNTEYPLLQTQMPNSGQQAIRPPPFRTIFHEWIYENERVRTYVYAGADETGANPILQARRIIYLPKDD